MIKGLILKAVSTALGRWVLGGVVAALLGGSALWWHSHKSDLREEGRQECIQKVNEETHRIAVEALAQERLANAELARQLKEAQLINQEANRRREDAERRLRTLRQNQIVQRETDETYREWSDTALPDGVLGRLQRAAGYTGADEADGN